MELQGSFSILLHYLYTSFCDWVAKLRVSGELYMEIICLDVVINF